MTIHDAVAYLLDEFYLGDKVYDVRSRALETDGVFAGNSWEHPAVTKFSEAVKALEEFRREEPK